jgi:hypothetical protein
MRTRVTIGVRSLLLAAPCFAGDLEDGVRLYDKSCSCCVRLPH